MENAGHGQVRATRSDESEHQTNRLLLAKTSLKALMSHACRVTRVTVVVVNVKISARDVMLSIAKAIRR